MTKINVSSKVFFNIILGRLLSVEIEFRQSSIAIR